MKHAAYVALGIALLFVGALLYGTYRRTEEFTTMQGNYPAGEDIKKTVRAIMDQYYNYDISEFVKIENLNDILKAGSFRSDTLSEISRGVPAIAYSVASTDFTNKKDSAFLQSFRPFVSRGYSPSRNHEFDGTIESLHTYRRWLTDKIKRYTNDGKSNIEEHRHAPIEEMLNISLKLDAAALYIKNCMVAGYLNLAIEKTHPKPKMA